MKELVLAICDDDIYYVVALTYMSTMAFSTAFIVAYTVM